MYTFVYIKGLIYCYRIIKNLIENDFDLNDLDLGWYPVTFFIAAHPVVDMVPMLILVTILKLYGQTLW